MPRRIYPSEIMQYFNRFNYDELSHIRGREHHSTIVTGKNNKTYIATCVYDRNNDECFQLRIKK